MYGKYLSGTAATAAGLATAAAAGLATPGTAADAGTTAADVTTCANAVCISARHWNESKLCGRVSDHVETILAAADGGGCGSTDGSVFASADAGAHDATRQAATDPAAAPASRIVTHPTDHL